MKKFLLAVVAMYLLGIGPCDVLAMLRPATQPRPRIIDIIRHREPEPAKPEPPTVKQSLTVSPEIQWQGDRQYIVRKGVRHFLAWVSEKPVWGCNGNRCGASTSIIKPGQ